MFDLVSRSFEVVSNISDAQSSQTKGICDYLEAPEQILLKSKSKNMPDAY